MGQNSKGRGAGALVSLLLFVAVLAVLAVATMRLTSGTDEEGLRATGEAIERASVLCYATEGFYPPGIRYIEENYGVQIDHDRYVVSYDIFASNIRPIINVSRK